MEAKRSPPVAKMAFSSFMNIYPENKVSYATLLAETKTVSYSVQQRQARQKDKSKAYEYILQSVIMIILVFFASQAG
jgi:hypothetical protein